MGLIGCIRATTVNIAEPIWKCPEIWVAPDFIDRCAGWSWQLTSSPIDDTGPWRMGLDCFIGHCFTYLLPDSKVLWRIDKVDHGAGLLLGRWPD